jgi:wyosine [tRNA(Phe)-imidazoG37] synthetase (radical SAM superfamily)
MNGSDKQLDVSDHSRDSVRMTYVYPVVSRRAGGVSVGINLNPNNACNWRCIYCQVPGLERGAAPLIELPLLEHELRCFIDELLQGGFMQSKVPEGFRRVADVAFSGNGEPTSAREFPLAVALVGRVLRETGLAGSVTIRVITNGSLLGRKSVQEGLRLISDLGGEAWFKVDAGTAEGYRCINGIRQSPAAVADRLRRCAGLCRTWVQTCLFALDGHGPTEEELSAYVSVLAAAGIRNLAGVHLYGLARPSLQPEAQRLSRLSAGRLEEVGARLRRQGLTVMVSP